MKTYYAAQLHNEMTKMKVKNKANEARQHGERKRRQMKAKRKRRPERKLDVEKFKSYKG